MYATEELEDTAKLFLLLRNAPAMGLGLSRPQWGNSEALSHVCMRSRRGPRGLG
jgi:hypothetical protein